jgi:hypothetical protein
VPTAPVGVDDLALDDRRAEEAAGLGVERPIPVGSGSSPGDGEHVGTASVARASVIANRMRSTRTGTVDRTDSGPVGAHACSKSCAAEGGRPRPGSSDFRPLRHIATGSSMTEW